MTITKKITSVELMDNMPTGTHRVIIDTYEEEKYDDYTYLNFQLVGIEGEVLDRQIKHGVNFPKSGKTTGKSKLGKLIKAAFPEAKGKIDFENDLLRKGGSVLKTGILGNCVFARFSKNIKHLTFAGCQSEIPFNFSQLLSTPLDSF